MLVTAAGGPRPVSLVGTRLGLLDDDVGFQLVLAKRLERLGWSHRRLARGSAAGELAASALDALVVDLHALGSARWRWLARACESGAGVALVVCSAASSPQERVHALHLGVDDWITKPCHPEELLARLEAILRHRRRRAPAYALRFGEAELRPDQFGAYVQRESLRLTPREYQVLTLLARFAPEPVAREAIYERVWGYAMARNDRSVDVFVHKLRAKLRAASPQWSYIHTHPGFGYALQAERRRASAPGPAAGEWVAPQRIAA